MQKEIKESGSAASGEALAAKEDEESEFLDGFVPMTEEEWESLPE